ncbi:MAG: imidazole glycerol phosphate synthase subunit HisF, partial [Actinomycetia bacterium]|nr:imidazole glycerol phosphate synthase subunit HisF [Actinomycetes bacterium]
MDYIRVIPCLDTVDGRVVKGINFVDLKDAGDPVEMAAAYDAAGADEIVFLDITATNEDRPTMREVASATKDQVNVPFIVGGGMHSLEDVERMLEAGADKVSLNSAVVKNPELIDAISKKYGSERLIVAIDARQKSDAAGDEWEVMINGGKSGTGIDAIEWAREVADRGAGQILVTSMDRDGVQDGYDLALTRAVKRASDLPTVASGGAGKLEHFVEAVVEGEADAVLAAS